MDPRRLNPFVTLALSAVLGIAAWIGIVLLVSWLIG